MATSSIDVRAEREPWTHVHTWMMVAFMVGALLESYIYSMSAVATGWVVMPKILTSLMLAWSPAWLIIGIAVAGPLSDRIGRRRVFFGTMSLYGIGAIILVLSHNYVPLLVALAILLFAAGGELNTIMVTAQEMLPKQYRTTGYYFIITAISIGTVVLGAVGFSAGYQHAAFQRTLVALTLLGVVAILLIARLQIPESYRWLDRTGRKDEAREAAKALRTENRLPDAPVLPPGVSALARSTGFRVYITSSLAFANTVGYGLLGFAIGPYYFPHLTSWILFVSGVGGLVGGAAVAVLGNRWGRKSMLLWSTTITFGVTVIIGLTLHAWVHSLFLLWVFVAALNLFGGAQYVGEDCLKSEIWPTMRRGTLTATARFISIGLLIPILFWTAHFSMTAYIVFNAFVWFVGAVAAVLWYVFGYETGSGVSIDVASQEAAPS